MLGLAFTNNTNLQSLEVVDRGSETQLQVAENLNFSAQCKKKSLGLSKSYFEIVLK